MFAVLGLFPDGYPEFTQCGFELFFIFQKILIEGVYFLEGFGILQRNDHVVHNRDQKLFFILRIRSANELRPHSHHPDHLTVDFKRQHANHGTGQQLKISAADI